MAEITAAPATANAAAASSSSSSAATSSTTPPLRPLPELLASDSFDVEAVLAGTAPASESATKTQDSSAATGTESPGDEGNERTDDQQSSGQEATQDGETEDASGDDTITDEHGEAEDGEKAEVVQDQNGKKLINVRHFNRMMRQRNEAKQAAREALSKVEAAEARAQAAEAKLSQVDDKPVVVPAANDPLSSVTDEAALEASIQNATAWRNWARRNLNGGTPPIPNAEEMTPEQVADALEAAESILEAAPKKREFLQGFAAKRAEVRKLMPQMFTVGTPEHAEAEAYRRQLLNFRTAAEQDAIIAKLMKIDRQEREERQGLARYTRVALKKDAADQQGKTLPQVVTTKPSPKPTASTASSAPAMRATTGAGSLSERLRTADSLDAEEILAGA